MRRLAEWLVVALLLCSAWPALAANTRDAVQACQNLLPVFVQNPASISIATDGTGEAQPFGVTIRWTSSQSGDGWIRCWFLPRTETGGSWQFTQVQTSGFGTLSRYDVQQAFKMLRLKQREARVPPQPVPEGPLVPWLYLLQQVLNALTLACVYGLVAVAVTLTAAAARTTMFAFGELASLGGWLFLIVHVGLQLQAGLPVVVTIMAGLVVSALTAGLAARMSDRLVFRRIRYRSSTVRLIASIGLAIAAAEAIRLAVGNKPRQMSVVADARIVLVQGHGFDVSVTSGHLWVAAGTLAIALLLSWLVGRTAYGRCLRAIVQDPSTAALLGVDVDRVIGRTFLLAGALGGIGGLALVAEYGVVDHASGLAVTLKALTAAILGGIGSIPGALIGGLAVAVLETAAAGYGDAAWKDVYVLAALVTLLIFRPEGLFATPRIRSADEPLQ
jgi:branched-chain amino acid transport system permease protein